MPEQDLINQLVGIQKDAEQAFITGVPFFEMIVGFQKGAHHLRPLLNFYGGNIQLSRFKEAQFCPNAAH